MEYQTSWLHFVCRVNSSCTVDSSFSLPIKMSEIRNNIKVRFELKLFFKSSKFWKIIVFQSCWWQSLGERYLVKYLIIFCVWQIWWLLFPVTHIRLGDISQTNISWSETSWNNTSLKDTRLKWVGILKNIAPCGARWWYVAPSRARWKYGVPVRARWFEKIG